MTTETTATNSKPTHTIYAIETSGDKTYWHKIGSAWENEKGALSLKFFAYPANNVETVILPVDYKK